MRLYVYVDGSDLDAVEDELCHSFRDFASHWSLRGASLVDLRIGRTADLTPADIADRFLGLNVEAESVSAAQVNELLAFLQATAARTGRDFAIGLEPDPGGPAEDICYVGAGPVEAERSLLVETLG